MQPNQAQATGYPWANANEASVPPVSTHNDPNAFNGHSSLQFQPFPHHGGGGAVWGTGYYPQSADGRYLPAGDFGVQVQPTWGSRQTINGANEEDADGDETDGAHVNGGTSLSVHPVYAAYAEDETRKRLSSSSRALVPWGGNAAVHGITVEPQPPFSPPTSPLMITWHPSTTGNADPTWDVTAPSVVKDARAKRSRGRPTMSNRIEDANSSVQRRKVQRTERSDSVILLPWTPKTAAAASAHQWDAAPPPQQADAPAPHDMHRKRERSSEEPASCDWRQQLKHPRNI